MNEQEEYTQECYCTWCTERWDSWEKMHEFADEVTLRVIANCNVAFGRCHIARRETVAALNAPYGFSDSVTGRPMATVLVERNGYALLAPEDMDPF